jgi:cell division septation protein DedD
MARNDDDPRPNPRPSRGPALLRFVYGSGLLGLGACLGIVIGSLSETPRLLLERLRGPVETVEIASPEKIEKIEEPAASKLEVFGDLQEGKAPKPAKAPPANAKPAAEVEPPPELVPAADLPTPAPPPVADPVAPAVAAAPPPSSSAPSQPPAAIKPTGAAVVQVASYVERKPAEELVAKLKSTGFQAYVSQPAAVNGRFRVRIRPDEGESAGDLAKRLRGFGFDTWATTE